MLLGDPRKEAMHVGAGSWRQHCFHQEDQLPRTNLEAEAVEVGPGARREASLVALQILTAFDCREQRMRKRRSGTGRWLHSWGDRDCSREKCRGEVLSKFWKRSRT